MAKLLLNPMKENTHQLSLSSEHIPDDKLTKNPPPNITNIERLSNDHKTDSDPIINYSEEKLLKLPKKEESSVMDQDQTIIISSSNNKEERVYVRNVLEEERIQISFKFPPSDGLVKQRTFNFDRPKNEEVEKTLVRISANVSKQINKKINNEKKNKSLTANNDANGGLPLVPHISLYDIGETLISGNTLNERAWSKANKLKIDDYPSYNIELNAPTVKSITIPSVLMAGFTVYPKIISEFYDPEDCLLTWYREEKKKIIKMSRNDSSCEDVDGGRRRWSNNDDDSSSENNERENIIANNERENIIANNREQIAESEQVTERDSKSSLHTQHLKWISTSSGGGVGQVGQSIKCLELSSSLATVADQIISTQLVDSKSLHPQHLKWTLISSGIGSTYTPMLDDVGLLIKVDCLPVERRRNSDSGGRGRREMGRSIVSEGEVAVSDNEGRVGERITCISKHRVIEGPGQCPFEKRHRFTIPLESINSFRVICYNLLADLYADSDFSRDNLFSHCPAQVLDMNYRKQLLLKELVGYNGDIVCLQEVDRKFFENELGQVMGQSGLNGLFKMKGGKVVEGCATFYNRDKFEFIESYDIDLKDYLQETDLLKDVREQIGQNQKFNSLMNERNSILQTTLLKSRGGRDDSNGLWYVLVSTVHLFFHPMANNVRLLQTHVCISRIQQIMARLKNEQGIEASVIYCGDFNAGPRTGVHEYLSSKKIPANHADWYSGGKEQLVNLALSHELDLLNACGFPRYTNYVGGFNSCLDYIYYQNLISTQVLPMPSHEDVVRFTALPNQVFPSDHLAIGSDFTWSSTNQVEPGNL